MTYTPIPAGTLDWDVPVNAAFTDQDTRITANAATGGANSTAINTLQSNNPSTPNVLVPAGWGQFWRPKRNNSINVPAKVMTVGDSVTQGFYCSNLKTKSWPALMRNTLQGTYGNGGSGMFSTSSSNVNSAVSAPVQAQWEGNGSYLTTTGTWVTGILFGPGISHLRATNTATLTFPGITGTSIRLWYITGGAPRAAWQYAIDGGAPVNVPAVVGATTIAFIDVAVSAGTHSVVITWNGTAGDVLDFIGVAGYNSTGVVVDNLARSGTNSTQWSTASLLTSQWNGGVNNPCDLMILSLGINDAVLVSTVADTYYTNMYNFLQSLRLGNGGATDVILVIQHFGSSVNANLYIQYINRMYSLAALYGAAVVNVWPSGRTSWDYSNTVGFWGDANNAGPAGTNSVHPSDAGHQAIANLVTPLVMS